MSNGNESQTRRSVVMNWVPWLVAAGALAVYGLTLNHWVSLFNLDAVVKVSGWNWRPEIFHPAYYLVTLPVRWLPPAWVPLALNLLSAVFAALTLAQLARSVALLPHDRTHEQREREGAETGLLSVPLAWIPPVLAALVCGLQLTFWEHATNGTSEMLDLLLFAFVIRALLEFRHRGNDRWLFAAALTMGVGITSNIAMIACFPLFVGALIWIRGLGFFNLRFLGRMTLFGLAGLSLYLLLPLLASLNPYEPAGFWQSLKGYLGVQKFLVTMVPRQTVLLLSLVSIVPLIGISIRWASHFGDSSRVGQIVTTTAFHLMHAMYLVACIWIALDPAFSPRVAAQAIPYATFLSLYYLAALCIGYFAGYFLIVFGKLRFRGRRPVPALARVHTLSSVAVVLLLIAAPAMLRLRNLREIQTTNGPLMAQFAALQSEGLPDQGVILSDDARRLFTTRAWLARAGRDRSFVWLDTQSLERLGYHEFLHNQHPERWAAPDEERRQLGGYDSLSIVELFRKQSAETDLFYLHPSFGYYFEVFYPEPRGLLYQLRPYPANSLLPPPLPSEVVTNSEAFWQRVSEEELQPLLALTTPRDPAQPADWVAKLFDALRLPERKNQQAQMLGVMYSRSANYWGVELQKRNQLEAAARLFELALNLNPDNVVAEVNLEYNKNLRAGERGAVHLAKSIEDRFGQYRSWDQVLTVNGPYDEPSFSYAQAYAYLKGSLYRQSAVPFARVREFSPTDLPSRFWLGQLYLMAQKPDETLALIQEIRDQPQVFQLDATNRADVLALEASAWLAKGQVDQAHDLIEQTLARHPGDPRLLATAINLYSQSGQHTNALAVLNRQLAANPDDALALLNKGYVAIQLEQYEEAVRTLTHLISLDTNNPTALLNRAIAQLRNNQLDAAKADYDNLQRQFPTVHQLNYGLAEIAWRRQDTNAAIIQYEGYLSNAPPNTAEARFVAERLATLKSHTTN